MIRSFKHKGLERFFITGSKKGIQPEQAEKIAHILDHLDASISPLDMNLSGYRLHELKGQETGTWSVTVNGNLGKDAVIVDYKDYH